MNKRPIEKWMHGRTGVSIISTGEKGKLTGMDTYVIDGVSYASELFVRPEGFDPYDVEPLKEVSAGANSKNIQEIINQVTVECPNLTVSFEESILKEFRNDSELPSEEIIQLVNKYLIRYQFVFTPFKPTEQQKTQREQNRNTGTWLRDQILQSGYAGKFSIIRFGHVWVVTVNPDAEYYSERVNMECFAFMPEDMEVQP